MSKLIIPILNSTASLSPGPTHYLDNLTKIDKLTDAEFGHVSKTNEKYASRFKTEHRCIFIETTGIAEIEAHASQTATRLRYVLNNFMASHALLLEFAVHIETNARGKLTKAPTPIDFGEDSGVIRKTDSSFRLKSGTKREDITQFYGLVKDVCTKHKRLYLTLSRFNSSLTRAKPSDRIIDATISLESMVQDDKNELSFKFALLNSFASNKDPVKRLETFELLKKLYNTRSTIVHGANDEAKEQAAVTSITEKWDEIEAITRKSINEFIFFARDNDPKTWSGTLLKRIVAGQIEHPNSATPAENGKTP